MARGPIAHVAQPAVRLAEFSVADMTAPRDDCSGSERQEDEIIAPRGGYLFIGSEPVAIMFLTNTSVFAICGGERRRAASAARFAASVLNSP